MAQKQNFYSKQSTNSTIAWMAMVLSVTALIVSLVVFTQSQGGVPGTLKDLQMQVQSLREQAAINNAVKSLENLRSGIASGGIPIAEAQNKITQIRSDLSAVMQNAGPDAKKTLQSVDNELVTLGQSLKGGTVSVLNLLDKAIVALKKFIQ